jgi:hypothetical protein
LRREVGRDFLKQPGEPAPLAQRAFAGEGGEFEQDRLGLHGLQDAGQGGKRPFDVVVARVKAGALDDERAFEIGRRVGGLTHVGKAHAEAEIPMRGVRVIGPECRFADCDDFAPAAHRVRVAHGVAQDTGGQLAFEDTAALVNGRLADIGRRIKRRAGRFGVPDILRGGDGGGAEGEHEERNNEASERLQVISRGPANFGAARQ